MWPKSCVSCVCVCVCFSSLWFSGKGQQKSFLFPFQGGLSSVAYVKVDLVDINDNRPTFYPVSYAVSLSTQSAPGTSVVRVMAYDPDSGENGKITYKTAPGGASPYFTLNKDTG